jgi:hypothetical protein
MSWRTQGQYRGLGEAESAWLRDFDRQWDTKAGGREQTDALERLHEASKAKAPRAGVRTDLIPAPETRSIDRLELEASLIKAAVDIARFTVPRQTKAGWSIHLVMKCGQRVRAHFDDLETASQAYEAIEEFLQWFPRG